MRTSARPGAVDVKGARATASARTAPDAMAALARAGPAFSRGADGAPADATMNATRAEIAAKTAGPVAAGAASGPARNAASSCLRSPERTAAPATRAAASHAIQPRPSRGARAASTIPRSPQRTATAGPPKRSPTATVRAAAGWRTSVGARPRVFASCAAPRSARATRAAARSATPAGVSAVQRSGVPSARVESHAPSARSRAASDARRPLEALGARPAAQRERRRVEGEEERHEYGDPAGCDEERGRGRRARENTRPHEDGQARPSARGDERRRHDGESERPPPPA